MNDEFYILRDILECVARQRGLFQALGSMTRQQATALKKLDSLSDQITVLEDRLWWIRFINYCNTPCWRFAV